MPGAAVGVGVRGAIHVQSVNACQSRLRDRLQPFRGVASHYLANYLGWGWELESGRAGKPHGLLLMAIGTPQPAASPT